MIEVKVFLAFSYTLRVSDPPEFVLRSACGGARISRDKHCLTSYEVGENVILKFDDMPDEVRSLVNISQDPSLSDEEAYINAFRIYLKDNGYSFFKLVWQDDAVEAFYIKEIEVLEVERKEDK